MYTNKMPVGRLSRKSSTETLDSTLDSRMSSSDIPKMELLKINYVHQCKEALMPRTTEPLPLPPRLPQRISSSSGNYNFSPYNKMSPETSQNGHVTKVMLGTAKNKNNAVSQVPPLPIIESWNFLQNTETNSTPSTPTTPKFVVQQRPLEDSDDNEQNDLISCCNSACLSSSSESERSSSTDTLKTPHAEVSKSWDYRTQISTRDLRRDISRAGIKSRADRIAHIERSECDHLQHSSKTNMVDMVSRINQLFENSGAKPRASVQKDLQQPLRQAPIPKKEPNMRRRPFSVSPEEMALQSCCCNCSDIDSLCEIKKKSGSLDNRNRNSAPVQGKHLSRIPKPINDRKQRISETNEKLQRNFEEMFEQGSQQNRKLKPQTDAKSRMKASKSIDGLAGIKSESEKNVRESEHLSDFDHKLLRNACQSYGGDNHKMKVERIHIRKKRQPLLIINRLNDDETKTCNNKLFKKIDVQTCGYKNCNLSNCPISSHSEKEMLLHTEDLMKRFSLESCSDSGISSTHDNQEQSIKENNLKNLEKCSDCVKILENQHTTALESEHTCLYAAINKNKISDNKLKDIEHTDGKQIKIYVSKKQIDNNDVQYFSNKNLTKMTTDEILNTVTTKSKQCNIENDMRNIEQRKYNHSLQTTTIQIDDEWVKESTDISDLRKPPLAEPVKPQRKPINCSGNDNAVKIFVRSSASNDTKATTAYSSRASSLSAMSYASQTSGISSASSISSAASTKSTTSSICECMQLNQEKCFQPNEGLFINRHQVPEIPPRRRTKDVRFAAPPPPLSPSLSAASTSSSSYTLNANPSNVGGVFWNNNYFCNETNIVTDANNENCCCDCLSSCEEDNCSYYEIECATSKIPKTPPQPTRTRGKNTYVTAMQQNDSIMTKKQQSKKLHNSIEELLIRKCKPLRKVSQ